MIPRPRATAINDPAATAARCRRTNFLTRYAALGGAASTASPERCLPTSAARSLAVSYRRVRSFSRAFITIQSRSPRTCRPSFAGSIFLCGATEASVSPRVLIRALGRGRAAPALPPQLRGLYLPVRRHGGQRLSQGADPRARARRVHLADDLLNFPVCLAPQVLRIKRRRPREQLVQHHAEGVHIAPRVDVQPAHLRLLGAHVLGR